MNVCSSGHFMYNLLIKKSKKHNSEVIFVIAVSQAVYSTKTLYLDYNLKFTMFQFYLVIYDIDFTGL